MEKMFVIVSLMMKGKWSKGVTRMKTNIAVLTYLICIVMVTTAVKADVLLPMGTFQAALCGERRQRHAGAYGIIGTIVVGGWGNPTADADYNLAGMLCTDGITPRLAEVWYQVGVEDLNTLGIPDEYGTLILQADVNAIRYQPL